MRKKTNRNTLDRRGASSVEFAFVFPVVLTFILGSIITAQGFLVRDLSQLAAYEAARRGTVLDATAEDVKARAQETLRSINLRNVNISVTPETITNTTREIEVAIEVPMNANAWVAGPLLPADWTIGSSITLRKSDDQ